MIFHNLFTFDDPEIKNDVRDIVIERLQDEQLEVSSFRFVNSKKRKRVLAYAKPLCYMPEKITRQALFVICLDTVWCTVLILFGVLSWPKTFFFGKLDICGNLVKKF